MTIPKKLLKLFTIIFMLSLMLFAGCNANFQNSQKTSAQNDEIITAETLATKTYIFYYETGVQDVVVPSQTYQKGDTIIVPKDPTREGYVFAGWYRGGKKYNFGKMPAQNVTVVAYWDSGYTVTFQTGVEDQKIPSQTLSAGQKIATPQNPTREGYIFEGWYLSGTSLFSFSKMPQSDITLVAKWKKIYTLTFDSQVLNSNYKSLSLCEGDLITLPKVQARDGYVFAGWYDGNDLIDYTVMPQRNVTLVAKWLKIHTITFDFSVNGAGDYSEELCANEKIIYPTLPTNNGYLFAGWTLNGQTSNINYMPDEDTTLVATWKRAITVSFDTGFDDLKVSSISGLYGDALEAPPVLTKEGYRFMGWQLNGNAFDLQTIPNSNVNVVATWMQVQYNGLPAMFIDMYDTNGNEIHIDSVTKDAYVYAEISVTNTVNENLLNFEKAQLKGRGNGSWSGPKKGYRIKFDEKVALFGNPKSRHWVLNSAKNYGGFSDNTMFRNYLAYGLGREVFDNIDYATTVEFVDMYYNGEYWGVYMVLEQVRDANDRVDVDGEYGGEDTGYLLEYDSYRSDRGANGVAYFNVTGLQHGFSIHSPDPDEYAENGFTKQQFQAQNAFIKAKTQEMVTAGLSGDYTKFCQLVDEDSFVDMYILHELFKNTDCGWSSFYIGKHAGGEFFCTAPWDFDATAGISRGEGGYTGIYVADTVRNYSSNTAFELFIALYQNESFKRAVRSRWRDLSPNIKAFISREVSTASFDKLSVAMGRNFYKWEGGSSQANGETRWQQAVTTLKTWLLNRASWLDKEWE